MKNKKIVSVLSIAALTTMLAGAVDASALSWKDGAPANYYFTYSGNNGNIESVEISDKNNTYDGNIEVGQTVTTKTGTIVWRDSYTNVTTVTVDVASGYKLDSITGNVGDATIKTENVNEGIYTFQFTDKGAEAWCYGDDVDFTLNTAPINYKVVDKSGNEVKTEGTIIGSKLVAGEDKEGYTFDGWYFNGKKVETITEDMVKTADENNVIEVEGKYTAKEYNVNVELYYNNDNELCGDSKHPDARFEQGKLESTLDLKVAYDTEITEDFLHENGVGEDYKLIGGKSVVVKGDTRVKVVKADENHASNEYKFIYKGATDGIKSVTYQVDNNPIRTLDVNEAIEIVQNEFTTRNVVFTVEVEEGKTLKLNCPGSKNEVTSNGNRKYSFGFTLDSKWDLGYGKLFAFTLEAVDAE